MKLGPATPPPLAYLLLEGRAVYELASTMLTRSWLLEHTPEGDGHPVVVLPGFIASGTSTQPLRDFLTRKNYRSLCWKQGRNLGMTPELEERMLKRLDSVYRRFDAKISLVGWSLGGIYARWLANSMPQVVRSVITLGSPFTDNPKANHSWKLFERLSGRGLDDIDPDLMAAVRSTPPVPTTSIYTRTDGITSWRCCVTEETEQSENIQVPGSHCGLGVNPLVLHVIADRLAQPEGQWRRFRRSGLRRMFYPRPLNQRREFATHGESHGESHGFASPAAP